MSAEKKLGSQEISLSQDCWLHTKSTVSMLYLSMCQIETSIVDSNESVQQLTNTFTQLAEQTLRPPEPGQSQADVWTSDEMRERINQAITAFQFYDRINQRLDHVSTGLEKMTEMFNNPDQLNDLDAWKKIQSDVESSYSMACERLMYERIMKGDTVAQAVATYKSTLGQEEAEEKPDDDIELF